MSGTIWIRKEPIDGSTTESNFIGDLVHSTSWECFGHLLEQALSNDEKLLLNIMSEENLVFKYLSFVDLNAKEFNVAVNLIRTEISRWNKDNLERWQIFSKEVWEDICEPLVVQDERYDSDFFVQT